ncbi:MAG: WYL domain-containing transcriptional regulator [Ruminococcus sp.]|nr:WYL domain-containing transcriptional regulator [Ruminococcus sp.]
MESFEPKKLALIRIWQILKEYSDYKHPMTQEDIARHLEDDYGIVIERKAISRNISLLKEAGIEIESVRAGSYLDYREFEDAELRMLIDGVLSSKYITAARSKDLIERICGLSNKYFKASLKNIHSVNDWSKTDNTTVFFNIEMINRAIERRKQLQYDYNKYGIDKKLHIASHQRVSPYQMILHNQRYYLMARDERWGDMVFHRLDHITDISISDEKATPIKNVKGYENGISYKDIAAMPYLYTDTPEQVIFLADAQIIDQIIDWFGTGVKITKADDESKVRVSVKASPMAMEYWALQYVHYVEVIQPESLRGQIRDALEEGLKKYQ